MVMDNKDINAISNKVLIGRLSVEGLGFLDEFLKQLSDHVDDRIYKHMNANKPVDGNVLIQAYSEKKAYDNIRRALLQNQKVGQSSGVKFKKLMEKNDGSEKGRTNRDQFSPYRG